MPCRLFVGNLPYSATKEDISSEFARVGLTATNVHIPNDRETGRPRGFAFVDIQEHEDKAMAATTGMLIGQRAIRIEVAEQRQPPSGGGGGGNRRENRPSGGGGQPDRRRDRRGGAAGWDTDE